MNCSPSGSSVQGIFQARTLEWVAVPSSRGSSWPKDGTGVSTSPALASRFFTTSATWEAPLSFISQPLVFLLCRHELLVSIFKADTERYLLFQMLISICSLSWGAGLSSDFFPFPDPTCHSPLGTSQKQELVSVVFFCPHKANDPRDFSSLVCSFLPPLGQGLAQSRCTFSGHNLGPLHRGDKRGPGGF